MGLEYRPTKRYYSTGVVENVSQHDLDKKVQEIYDECGDENVTSLVITPRYDEPGNTSYICHAHNFTITYVYYDEREIEFPHKTDESYTR